jgi:hypothetical protein
MSKGRNEHVRMCQYQLPLLTTGRMEAQVGRMEAQVNEGMSKAICSAMCQYQLSLLTTREDEEQINPQDTNPSGVEYSLVHYNTLLTVSCYKIEHSKTNPKKCREQKQPHYMKL